MDLSIVWAMRGTCRSWRTFACGLKQPPCCFTLPDGIDIKGLMWCLNGTGMGLSTTYLTEISCSAYKYSYVQCDLSCCAVYTAIGLACPQLQTLTLYLEGPENGWHGVSLLPECLTSLTLGTYGFAPEEPLTVFSGLKQLRLLHLVLQSTENSCIGGDLYLPHLQLFRIDGYRDECLEERDDHDIKEAFAVCVPEFTHQHIPASCMICMSTRTMQSLSPEMQVSFDESD